jgi:hypothetical protein
LPPALRCIAIRQGVMLLASDADLVQVRAGNEHPTKRPMLGGIAPVRAVSVERRRKPRLAVGGPRSVAVLDGQRVATLRMKAPRSPVEHIAWGPHPNAGSAVYLLTKEGGLDRALPDTGDLEEVPLGALVAMAAGDDGSIAVASIDPDAPAVWTTSDGAQWQYRILEELDGVGGWHLAVSGGAVALSIAWRGVWISRGLNDPFVKCEALGEGGAIVFAGDKADAPLVCAVHEDLTATIVRVDAGGAAARIAAVDAAPGGEEPQVDSLAWDASRGVLWALTSKGGLLRVERPRAGGPAALS